MWVVMICLLLLVLTVLLLARNHALGMTRFKERPEVYAPTTGLQQTLRIIFCGLNAYRSRISTTPDELGYGYSRHVFAGGVGVELVGWHIPREDSRSLVLLVNWLGGCKSDNLAAAEIFLEQGQEVFLLDMRGHGDSSGMETSFGYYEYRDLLAGVEYVKAELAPERLILYGVSLGAVAIMRAFALGEVRGVAGVILETPFDRLINTIRNRMRAMHLPTLLLSDILALTGGGLQGYNPYAFNPVEYAAEINVPVLLVQRTGDPYVSVGEMEQIYARLGALQDSELILVEAGGHGPVIWVDSERFREEVQAFLLRLKKVGR